MSQDCQSVSRSTVLSYPVDLINLKEAMSIIEKAWNERKGLQVVTINAEMIIAAQTDMRLDNIIRHANLLAPDGAGIVLALQMAGKHVKRLPGIELAQASLVRAAEKNIPVALIGGETKVLEYLSRTLPVQYSGLQLVLVQDGYYKPEDEEKILQDLSHTEAQLVLVAMGVPRQEYFIEQAKRAAPQAVFIGVGGSFDIWAGIKKRARKLFQSLHLEWLYRLLSEPWRFKRMSTTLPKFACQVIVEYYHRR